MPPVLALAPAAAAAAGAGTAATTAITAGTAIAGAVAGGMSDKSSSKKILGKQGSLEANASNITEEQLLELNKLTKAGAGEADVAAGAQGQRDLASLLKEMQESGGLPSQKDVAATSGFAQQIFRPQEQAARNAFIEQQQRVNQLAAQLGRSVDDPILQAKLAQQQTQQLGMIRAEQGAFGAQLALQQPMQRLGFAQERANVLAGLGQQAFSNRAALASLGQGILFQQQNFRLGSAETQTESGGGLKGALQGGIAGLGMGGSIASMFGPKPQYSIPQAPKISQQQWAPPQTMGGQALYSPSGMNFDFYTQQQQQFLNKTYSGAVVGERGRGGYSTQ